jgi:hypothetical protein
MKNMILISAFLFSACGQNPSPTIAEKQTNNKEKYTGVYEYVYPNNTSDLIENHYIVLINNDNKLEGFYYGTSDEFDEAREGYLPAFFVTKMEDLIINNDTIKFTLHIQNSDLFTQPVDLKYKTTTEALNAGFIKWENKIPTPPKSYSGFLKDERTIFFKTKFNFTDKTFIKK